MSTPLPFPVPPPGSVYAQMWMAELSDDERTGLPGQYHRPHFDSLGVPPAWICEACWSDGCTTAWPCAAVICREDGLALAESLNLGCSR